MHRKCAVYIEPDHDISSYHTYCTYLPFHASLDIPLTFPDFNHRREPEVFGDYVQELHKLHGQVVY
jgi:hypothetical protein